MHLARRPRRRRPRGLQCSLHHLGARVFDEVEPVGGNSGPLPDGCRHRFSSAYHEFLIYDRLLGIHVLNNKV